MARKKDERIVKQAYKEGRKAKAAQKKTAEGGASGPYLQPSDEHFISFKNQLATMGLMLRDVSGDGNCLFRALNDQLEGHSRNHLNLRQDTVRFMMEHREDFEPFVEDDVPFQTHVRQLSQPGTYGGHDALVAFARMLKVTIVIHQLNSPLWQIEGGPSGCPQLHLSYHNGEHYSSVRRVGDTSESPANIRMNIASNSPRATSSNGADKAATHECDFDDTVQRISNRTGCKDLAMAREALIDCDGDAEEATNHLMGLMLATDSGDSCGIEGEVESLNTNAATGTCCQGGNSTLQRVNKQKASAKKLTNKQRKDQSRRDKLLRLQDRAVNDQKALGGHENGHDVGEIEMEKVVLSKEELPPHKRSHSPEEKPATTSGESSSSSAEQETVQSANNWEAAEMGDEERKAKFLRLMGAAKKEHKGRFVIGSSTAPKPHGRSGEEERDLEQKLESQFQHSMADRLQHRNKKHRGLGFEDEAASSDTPHEADKST